MPSCTHSVKVAEATNASLHSHGKAVKNETPAPLPFTQQSLWRRQANAIWALIQQSLQKLIMKLMPLPHPYSLRSGTASHQSAIYMTVEPACGQLLVRAWNSFTPNAVVSAVINLCTLTVVATLKTCSVCSQKLMVAMWQ